MSRASFVGALEFRSVVFSVKAYATSSEEKEVEIKILHGACKAPIKQEVRCTYCSVLLEPAAQSRGFEHQGNWVVLDAAALAALKPSDDEKNILRILQVVPAMSLPERLSIKHYFLVPADSTAEKAYALFFRVLTETKRAAITTFVSYGKSHLGAVYPSDSGLMLKTLYYFTSLKQLEADHGYKVNPVALQSKERQLAKRLIASLEEPFDHAGFVNENTVRQQQVIQAVLASKPVPVPVYKTARPIDSLIEALERSVQYTKGSRDEKVGKTNE